MRRTLHSQDHTHSHTYALTLNCAQGPSLEEYELLEQQKLQRNYWNQQHQKKYEQLRGFVQQRKHKQTQSSVRQSVLSEKHQHQHQSEELLQQGQLSLQLRLLEGGPQQPLLAASGVVSSYYYMCVFSSFLLYTCSHFVL